MQEYRLTDSLISLEGLEFKCSPSFLAVGSVMAASLTSTVHATNLEEEDPLPEPEPAPPPYPGDDPPIEYPLLPPSGPAGPGK